ncbi:MAG TPA: glutathione binding-like protein [Woeseiaceae bacterium]
MAERFPATNLVPADAAGRMGLVRWLGFISTELHKAVFGPILDTKAPEAVKSWARDKAALRLGLVDKHLRTHEFLLDRFTVADGYLATVLNWAPACDVDLGAWPAVDEYHARVLARPAVAKAVSEERQLYKEQQARAAAR